MAVSFANLFMAAVETEILNASTKKTLVWKSYIDDMFSFWNKPKESLNEQMAFNTESPFTE